MASSQLEQQSSSSNEGIQRRRWRGRWLTWVIVGLFLLLVVGGPAIFYVTYFSTGQMQLAKEIDVIRQSGDPFTTDELTAWYKLPKGATDLTVQWHDALEPFYYPNVAAEFRVLPILNGQPAPEAGKPWPDEALVDRFLQTHRGDLDRLHKLAKLEGEVRYVRGLKFGTWGLLHEVDTGRPTHSALRVEFHRLLNQGRTADALENLRTQLKLSGTFSHDPFIISMIVRLMMDADAMSDLQALTARESLTDEQLSELQDLVRNLDYERHLRDALIGQRGIVYHAFYHGHTEENGFADGKWGSVPDTTTNTALIAQPEDCAMSLRLITAMKAAADKPLPDAIKELDRITQEYAALNNGSGVNRIRYYRTLMYHAGNAQFGNSIGEGAARRDAMDAMLAARRFQLKNGTSPKSLSELVPEFLPRVPVDPFNGKPLRMKVDADGVVIYSIGRDRSDDGGESDGKGPDVGIKMKLNSK